MATQSDQLLNWYATRNCWRKKYRGKMYYLGTGGVCKSPDDTEGYLAALGEFAEIKRRVDAGLPPRPTPDELTQKTVPPSPSPRESHVVKVRVPYLRIPVKHLAGMATDYSSDPDELPQATLAQPAAATLDELIDAFVNDFKQRALLEDVSISMYREIKDCLEDFQGYARKYERAKIENVDEHLLKCYRDRQRQLVQAGEFSPFTVKKRLANLKRFLEWAYRHRYLDSIPRNVDKSFAKVVKLPDPDPQPFTFEQVKAIWKEATSKTKFSRKSQKNALFILLGLNCGYRSGDIATLKHSHLRQENGFWIIERKREKTGSPQVHKLWPLTYQLLMEEATDPAESEIMLHDERGGLLVDKVIDRVGSNDCVGRCFNRVKLKAGIKGKNTGHAVLRDTGADAIKQYFPEVPHIVSQYLGHKPKGMQTHYTREHYDLLFKAIDWLDSHFGLKL